MIGWLQKRWPKADLEYLRLVASTLLALVLLPLVITHLLMHPTDVADHAVKGRIA